MRIQQLHAGIMQPHKLHL